ncbi:hypothetical protein KY362_01180 [Candidatus Woesearchaeota archaeon]|nr:hypothetical protein [Candidatus Woesearchaeota archaeon]
MTYFIKKKPESLIEQNVMNVGIGMGVVPILGIVLDKLRIILDWRVFLALSLIVPLYAIFKLGRQGKLELPELKGRFKMRKSSLYFLVVFCIFIIFLSTYLSGSFKYPYLEDDDPWHYSIAIKYISLHKTYKISERFEGSNYMEPYPQGFNILLGVLHQTSDSLIWTMKFFNSLVIALGVLFFFYFVKEFSGSSKIALIGTFVFSVTPWYLGHFVWSQTLSLTLFFPAFYLLFRIKEDWRHFIPAALVISGVLLSHELGAFIFGVMFGAYWIIEGIFSKGPFIRRFLNLFLAAALLGVVLSMLFYVPAHMKMGGRNYQHYEENKWYQLEAPTENFRIYGIGDFFIARTQSRIDTPIGLGIVLCSLLILSVILILVSYKSLRKRPWVAISLAWLVLLFLGLEGNALPVRVIPYRWGAFFVIPVVLLAAEGWNMLTSIKQIRRYGAVISILLVAGLLITSAYPKYKVQTANWPPGAGWGSMDELNSYLTYVPQLPENTRVFPLCSAEGKVIAFDKLAEPWVPEYIDMKTNVFNTSAEEIGDWLRSGRYEYAIADSFCLRYHSENETVDLENRLVASGRFSVAAGGPGFSMLRVV